jgi:hypothetical protein
MNFSALFCCEDHFKNICGIDTDTPNSEILCEHMLGNRYFVKFRCLNDTLKEKCTKDDDSLIMFTSPLPGSDLIAHCGIILKEEAQDEPSDVPKLTIKSKIMCLALACGDCNNQGCPGMAECHQLPLLFLSMEKMTNNLTDETSPKVIAALVAIPKFETMPSFLNDISIDI